MDMVHGQERSFWSVSFSKQRNWRVIRGFSFAEGIRVLHPVILGCCAMSRCFPFPPPGYEKKSTTDVGDLLKKEKEKERKHKKDNKDREKRDGKEKKDKDRSDGKNRDKKDKNKNRREKKERDKDKDRTSVSYEEKVNLQLEHNNNSRIIDKKHLGKSEGGNGKSFTQKGKENDVVRKSIITADKNLSMRMSGHNHDKFARNNHFSVHPEDSMVIQQSGQKIMDDDRGTRSYLDGKFSGDVISDEGVFKLVPKASADESKENIMRDCGSNLDGQRIGGERKVAGKAPAECHAGFDLKRDEGMIRVVTKALDTFDENKEKEMKVGDKRLSDQGFGDEMRFARNVISENLFGTTQTRIGLAKPLQEVSLKRIEGKEKTKQKESDYKHDKDNEKKSKRKNKDRDRDREKEEKSKDKIEPKKAETDRLNKSIKNDLTATSNVKPSLICKESTNAAVAAEGDPRKWKDLEQNGFMDANESEPVMLARPPPQLMIENGMMLKACQTSIFSPSGLQGAVDNAMVGNKEHMINGLIEAHALSSPATQSFSISPSNPLLTPSQVDRSAEVSQKPPHPDTKYLHEILSVPKVEEWLTFNDQEWLFQNNEPQPKKSKVCSYGADEMPLVWAETLRIDSADIYALPYVVPY